MPGDHVLATAPSVLYARGMAIDSTRTVFSMLREALDVVSSVPIADGLGVHSLAGLREAVRRLLTGDLHPAVVWSLHAASTPDRVALVQGDRRLTWLEVDRRINRLGNALRHLGIEPGDRVAIILPNGIEWFEAVAACQKIGAATVFVSYRSTAPELRFLLENSGASALLLGSASAAVAREASDPAGFPAACRIVVGEPVDGFDSYERFLEGASEEDPPAALRSAGARTIQYTSGTTGKPKGAVRDLAKTSLASFVGLLRRIPFRRSDRHLVAAPLYHATASGFAFVHVALGSTIHVLERFDPLEFLRAVDREAITTSALVPTMIRAIVEVPEDERRKLDLSSLRIIVSTGSALPQSVEQAVAAEFGDVLYDLYGATEMGYVSVATPQDKRACPGTIGKPFPGVDVALLDDQRRPVPDGEVGELFARSALTIEGYYQNDEATQRSRHGEYFSVGDLAVREEGGYLRLVGRKTDMVISGGMNVYPAEIEAVLQTHPAVREAAVVGVPDEKWGERLVAFMTLRTDERAPSDAELVKFAKKSLAGYKVPRQFVRVSSLPRNPTGKVLKQELRLPDAADEAPPAR